MEKRVSINQIVLSGAMLCLCLVSHGAVPGDEHWDNQFGVPGANAPVGGVAVIGKTVFIAGTDVTAAGNTKASGVAGFDGTNWFPLNSGLLNTTAVVGLGSDGNYLYVGGVFTNADDPNAIDTARWDGTNWSAVGINGPAFVFKRNGGILYVGGVFTSAGSAPATNIAGWNGTNWFALGTGVSGCAGSFCVSEIDALAFQGTNVIAGGNFTSAGGVSASYIAYYDGSAWHAMGNPFNGPVAALIFYNSWLYAGGSFTNAALAITNIARWDGVNWSAVPGGGGNAQIGDFATDGTNLFVGGFFTQIGGVSAAGVASFNGSTWSALGSGIKGRQGASGQVNKLAWSSNQLYAAGTFERAGNVGAGEVARWDGTNWFSLGGSKSKGIPPGITSIQSLLLVRAPSVLTTGLYAGGVFSEGGDVVVNRIGRWDGTNWNPVGSGVSGTFQSGVDSNARALATDGGYLYAGGNFTTAGANSASGIAYWDGNTWLPLGSGLDWIVNAIGIDNANYVYVGGTFTNAGSIYSRGFAVWAYGNWYNLGNVEGTNGSVNSIAYDGDKKVFIGGSFFTAGGVNATNAAYFDNSDFSWHALGSGLNAKANTVAYGNGLLYAGGSFTKAGGLTVNHIAQWDGSNWSALGSGITGGPQVIVNSILVSGTNVYVTGNFTNAGGVSATNIAKWNGSSWSALGSGLDQPKAGFALATVGNDVYLTGNFTTAGDKPAEYIARWNEQSNFYPTANMVLTRSAAVTNRQFRFRVTGTSGQSYIILGSSNLSSWTPLQTNSAMFYDFTDTNSAQFPKRFYRTVLGP